MDNYHGILVKEGLRDKKILNSKMISILGKKFDRVDKFTLLRVEVEESEIEGIIELVQENLLTNPTYYAHFYRANELMVIFPEKLFRISPDKSTWREAIDYGISVGIPKEQLTFDPCRFEDETY